MVVSMENDRVVVSFRSLLSEGMRTSDNAVQIFPFSRFLRTEKFGKPVYSHSGNTTKYVLSLRKKVLGSQKPLLPDILVRRKGRTFYVFLSTGSLSVP